GIVFCQFAHSLTLDGSVYLEQETCHIRKLFGCTICYEIFARAPGRFGLSLVRIADDSVTDFISTPVSSCERNRLFSWDAQILLASFSRYRSESASRRRIFSAGCEHRPVHEHSSFDDSDDVERVADVRERIAFDDDEIGELARLERPELSLEPEGERVAGRREAQDLIRRDTGIRKQGH